MALSLPRSQQKTTHFAFSGFLGRDIIGNLYGLYYMIALADNKVTFTRTVIQIVNIQILNFAFSVQMDGHDCFKSMSKVFTGKRILALIHQGNIYCIDFLPNGPLLTLL